MEQYMRHFVAIFILLMSPHLSYPIDNPSEDIGIYEIPPEYPIVFGIDTLGFKNELDTKFFVDGHTATVLEFQSYKASFFDTNQYNGSIVVGFIINKNGSVDSTYLISTPLKLSSNARSLLSTMETWHFETLAGEYQKIEIQYDFNQQVQFQPNERPAIPGGIKPHYGHFVSLDNLNAFNSEYNNFVWRTWKLAICFVNPSLSSSDLSYHNRVFRDLSSKETYWEFLTNEIAMLWNRNTSFAKAEWQHVPVSNTIDTLKFKDNKYLVSLPDSLFVTFRNTGCRFALLLQYFSPKMSVYNPSGMALMYENVAPEASKYQNYKYSKLSYSFSYTYVLYDLMQGKVVQFGKALDDNKDEYAEASDIRHCLDDAIMDILEISKF